MVKIKSISIKGFRGVKEELTLPLESKSILLFGENGSGKSSVTDAIEWYYNDSVKHLSSEEIDRKGITALKNIHIPDTEACSVSINYSDSNLNSKKELAEYNNKLIAKCSNAADNFKKYILTTQKENLILRYFDLIRFGLATKKERLDNLLNIIGFEEISKMRDTLRKATNNIKRNLRMKDYDNETSQREGQIMEQLGERIITDEQFVKKINELISPLGYKPLDKVKNIDVLLASFKQTDDSIIIEKRGYYNDVITKAKSDIKNRLTRLYELYGKYYQLFQGIIKEANNLKNIELSKLWEEGIKILRNNVIEEEKCPLCFQKKSREELIKEIEERLQNIETVKKLKRKLDEARNGVKQLIKNTEEIIASIKINKYYEGEENFPIKNFVDSLAKYISSLNTELDKELLPEQKVKSKDEIIYPDKNLDDIISFCQNNFDGLEKKLRSQKILRIQDKISLSEHAYIEIKKLKREKAILEKQSLTLKNIYNAFVKKQKEEIETFIDKFSKQLDEYYCYLHPGEKVGEIEIKTLVNEDELKGLTIEFEYFGRKVSPPQKYLSESHLNSLGLAFFLCSVKAFNERNNFFILDDVISSFDADHRKRLSDLLLEKFNDYQIFLLTHEKNWFDYMKNLVKRKNDWIINAVQWSEEKGSYLNETLIDSRSTIEHKIANNDLPGLENLIRKYLEKILKEICENIEVYAKYRSNETNEMRMANELLSELKSKINKQPETTKDSINPVINKIISSNFIGNRGSHDSSFRPSLGDCKAFWQDVISFQNLFYCSHCPKSISVKYIDNVKKKIRCRCGRLTYEWKI